VRRKPKSPYVQRRHQHLSKEKVINVSIFSFNLGWKNVWQCNNLWSCVFSCFILW
jgi:hypothetical protein